MLSKSLVQTILQGQQLRDWQVLRSQNMTFRLQFFSPGTSQNRYLGIFPVSPDKTSIQGNHPVWVGNRNDPIRDATGIVMINSSNGLLSIVYNGGDVILSTTSRGYGNINTSATLQNDGNLVLREVYPNGSISGILLWQSFDYPTDTLLPGMKLGIDFKTGREWSGHSLHG